MKSIAAIEKTQHGDKQHQTQADVKVSGNTRKYFVCKKIFEKKTLIKRLSELTVFQIKCKLSNPWVNNRMAKVFTDFY